eukprot:Sspe_Gene.52100::Locus_28877_Transcript_1_1_Confidence_1.000_Length_1351::g.52100::m.52100/K20603/MKK2; mitogen-activated protein kinase kinase 2
MAAPAKEKKRKPSSLLPVKTEQEFNITDSLTLQVQMPDGGQARVGKNGLCMPDPTRPHASPSTTEKKAGKSESESKYPESLLEPQHKQETFRFEDLRFGEVIGEGSQAKVRRVRHTPTRQYYAVKIITFGPDMTRKVLQTELSRCACIDKHPNLVESLEAYFKEGFLMVLMEYMAFGTLANVMKRAHESGKSVPEDVLSAIAEQVLQGLNHLHTGGGTGNGLIHRDLKPSNLLVNSDGQVKISDFGVATFLSKQQKVAFTAVGSTAYMSPERVRGDGYTTASDIWSVGVTLAELALGHFPIGTGKRTHKLFDLCSIIAEERAQVNWPEGVSLGPEFRDFVAKCMIQKPDLRPSAAELLDHPFVQLHKKTGVDLTAWFKSIMKPAASSGSSSPTNQQHQSP